MSSNSPATTKPSASWLACRLCLGLKAGRTAQGNRTDQGFTLIEALVAIVIVSITLVSITPPIFLATATRVQNRRAQQSLQIAQGEIDRVRIMVERQQTDALTYLPPLATGNVRASNTPPAPTGSTFARVRSSSPACNTDDGKTPAANGFLVDTDGDCKADFIVQTFRGGDYRDSATPITAPPDGFIMGVRVYSIVALGNTLSTAPASLRNTTGLGNQRNSPLAVLYATVARNNSSKSLEIYRNLCPQAAGSGSNGC